MTPPPVQPLPSDTAALQALVIELRGQVSELEQRLAWFTEQYRLGQHRRFAASSERGSAQLDLFAELLPAVEPPEPELAVDTSPADSNMRGDNENKRRGGRGPLPLNLPREEVVHDLTEDEKRCPCCRQAREVIGEQRSEQLDIIAPRLKVIEHVRLKYACHDCEHGGVATATTPAQPLPKSLASPGLLAYVIIAKLLDGLPLYRQSVIFKRLGVNLPRQTLAAWLIKVGDVVWPIVNLLHDELLSRAIVQADETTLQVLNEPGRAAQTKSYLWGYRSGCGPPILLFEYQHSRGGSHPKAYLEGFTGRYVQTDGYSGYARLCREAAFDAVACWTHTRRKFHDVVKARPHGSAPGLADEALAFIGALYRIERCCTDQGLSTDERLAYRQQHSAPIVEAFKGWLDRHVGTTLPKSLLGKAMRYTLQRWPALTRFLECGALELDTNALERVIKTVAIARKNFLFAHSPAGARAIANLYTLIETAKANGLEPLAYLEQVLTVLPGAPTLEAVEALLPWHCQAVLNATPPLPAAA